MNGNLEKGERKEKPDFTKENEKEGRPKGEPDKHLKDDKDKRDEKRNEGDKPEKANNPEENRKNQ